MSSSSSFVLCGSRRNDDDAATTSAISSGLCTAVEQPLTTPPALTAANAAVGASCWPMVLGQRITARRRGCVHASERSCFLDVGGNPRGRDADDPLDPGGRARGGARVTQRDAAYYGLKVSRGTSQSAYTVSSADIWNN